MQASDHGQRREEGRNSPSGSFLQAPCESFTWTMPRILQHSNFIEQESRLRDVKEYS